MRNATGGASHAWLAGEVAGNYQPWGYPFNWRELTGPLNASPSSFGKPAGNGALFLMADASVQFLSNKVDQDVLETMTSYPPLPNADLLQRPERTFDVVTQSQGHRWEWRDLDGTQGNLTIGAYVSPSGRVEQVHLFDAGHGDSRELELRDLRVALEAYPQAAELLARLPLDDEMAAVIADMNRLSNLHVRTASVSSAGLQSLSRLPRLRLVRFESLHEQQLDQLRRALPNCVISVRH